MFSRIWGFPSYVYQFMYFFGPMGVNSTPPPKKKEEAL